MSGRLFWHSDSDALPPRSRYPLNKGPVALIPPVSAPGPISFPAKPFDRKRNIAAQHYSAGTKPARNH